MTAMGETSCGNCYWRDENKSYPACIVSRGRTGDELCISCGGKVDRWEAWPPCPELGRGAMKCPKCEVKLPPIPVYALVEKDGKSQMPSEMTIKCMNCGHEEKVKLADPWNPHMADDDGVKS